MTHSKAEPQGDDGEVIGFVNVGASMSQTLDETFSADNAYILSVDLGNRKDWNGFPSYEFRLYAGDHLLGTQTGTVPEEGGWETVELRVNGPSFGVDFAGAGQALRIEVANTGSEGQVNFDNVELRVEEGIEPEGLVINPSFEDAGLSEWQYNSNVPGWETRGSAGHWNPPAEMYAAGGPTDGESVGYLDGRGVISQTLDATFEADRPFKVSVDIGDRLDLAGFPRYAILVYAGEHLIASATGARPDERGGWKTVQFTVGGSSFEPDFAGFGKNLRIVVVNRDNDNQLNIDNVELDFGDSDAAYTAGNSGAQDLRSGNGMGASELAA